MNQKSFVKVILIAIVVIVVGVIGYFVFIKKSVPIIQQQALPTENNSGPVGIVLPADCRMVGSKGDVDPSSSGHILSENEWLIDCGSKNNAARETLGPVLEQQGWTLCDSGLASGNWWKGGNYDNSGGKRGIIVSLQGESKFRAYLSSRVQFERPVSYP